MTEKDLRKFQGRSLIRLPVPGAVNIRRRYIWNKKFQRYVDPPRGGKFEAMRSRGKGHSRETKIFESLPEARAWQAGQVTQGSTSQGAYLVGDLLADWKRLAWPNFKETTRIFYDKIVEHFGPLLGVEVEALTPRHIDAWLATLKSPEYCKKYRSTKHTLEKEHEALRAMINWHREVNDETKLVSPFKKRHLKMLKVKEKTSTVPKFMTEDEFGLWLEHLKRDSFLIYVLALTQIRQVLRISEAAAMKWQNLNLTTRSYTVCEHVIWPRVNGAPPQILPGTKTLKGGDSFVSNLWKDVTDLLEVLAGERQGDLIFTMNGKPLEYRQIQYRYNKAFESAGLPFRSTHVCRHSGATDFLAKTNDPLALMQAGGWKDMKMALHYGQILSTRAKEAIEKAETEQRRARFQVIKGAKDDEAI